MDHVGARLTPRIHAITLGVEDLERSLAFYRDGLGFPTSGITGTDFPGSEREPAGAVVMFTLEDGLVLSLYPRSELAKDAGVAAERTSGSGLSIAHFVEDRAEVDRVLAVAAAAGAEILGEPHERPWPIYSGYFADPDGHLWEVLTMLERPAA